MAKEKEQFPILTKVILMKDFQQVLYEGVFVSFGKILAKYTTFAQGSILRDVGKELIDYLNRHGFGFEEQGDFEDVAKITELFIRNGFAEKLDVVPMDRGHNYIWHNLYGIEAYKELHDISDNLFLVCPLNACLYYLSDKYQKSFQLLNKSFDLECNDAESQYEIIDKESTESEQFDALVIENARLYELATERAAKLEKAYNETRTLRGILPICSSCKKIRDDEPYWQKLETYVHDHAETNFSHGYCPECVEKELRRIRRERVTDSA